MIKNGKIEIGKTPVARSGKPCSKIVNTEPLDKGEKPDNKLEKWAKMLDRSAPDSEEIKIDVSDNRNACFL